MAAVETFAPGKVILHGEHAVVYGTKAIAISLGLNTTVSITKSESGKIEVEFSEIGIDSNFTVDELKNLQKKCGPDFIFSKVDDGVLVTVNSNVQTTLEEFVNSRALLNCDEGLKTASKAAFEAFLFLYLAIFEDVVPINVKIKTELPVGAGLGSSASFGVALAGALLVSSQKMDKTVIDRDLVNRWAFASESFVHGNPSGLDNSIVTFGGAVLFRKGEPFSHLKCSEIRVVLVNTEVPRSTKDLVARVAALKQADPIKHQEMMSEINQLVENVAHELDATGQTTSEHVARNQDLLTQLSVSHPKIDLIVKIAKDHGLSGKLTGAGGGGCVFIYIPQNTENEIVEKLKSRLVETGLNKLWDITLGGEGFHIK